MKIQVLFLFYFFYSMDVALVKSHIVYQHLNENLNLLDSKIVLGSFLIGKHNKSQKPSQRVIQLKESLPIDYPSQHT